MYLLHNEADSQTESDSDKDKTVIDKALADLNEGLGMIAQRQNRIAD